MLKDLLDRPTYILNFRYFGIVLNQIISYGFHLYRIAITRK